MTTPKTLEDYGAPFVDLGVMQNPTGEMAASSGNRLCEDVAQLTRMTKDAFVAFVPVATAAVVAVTVARHRSSWGSGNTQKPTISKTATGLYTVTWASALVDGLNESETLAFTDAVCQLRGSTDIYPHPLVTSVTANTVSIRINNASWAAADAVNSTVCIWAE